MISVSGMVFIPGKYKTLINVPISIASALAASSVPALTAAYTNGKKEAVRSQINTAIRFIMVVAFPCAVGMGVLASPILQLLFRDSSELAHEYVAAWCCFYCIFLAVDALKWFVTGN
ncbi:MAG: lipid II flippase MurJ [Roseburia inulinivorans]